MAALYKPRAKLPSDFVAHFQPWNMPPMLREVTAPFLANLWDTLRCVGHPVQPHVHTLQCRDVPGVKISIATDNYFIIVTVTSSRARVPQPELLLATDHCVVMLGGNPHHLVTWHREIPPALVVRFLRRMDEDLIAQGILNPQTGRRKPGYTYVHGWTLEVPCAFPDVYSYINIRKQDNAGKIWQQCAPCDDVTIVPHFFGRTVLCRIHAARRFFDVLAHDVHRGADAGLAGLAGLYDA